MNVADLSDINKLAVYLAYYITGKQPESVEEARTEITRHYRTWEWGKFAAFSGIDQSYARKAYNMYLKTSCEKLSKEDTYMLDAQTKAYFIKTRRLPDCQQVMRFTVSDGQAGKRRAQFYTYGLSARKIAARVDLQQQKIKTDSTMKVSEDYDIIQQLQAIEKAVK